ncbi:MAG: diaminopimelate epimerase [bacterium]|nr:diaminopimelate epimerase [bacterium]
MKIKFTKMVGSGNDFVLIDNREKIIKEDLISMFTRKVCHRTAGIGSDGLILIEFSVNADFTMRIINTDGSEAEMCGNGARCAAYFAYVKGIAEADMTFNTLAGVIGGVVDARNVKVKMIDPHSRRDTINLGLESAVFQIDTGVPHAVLFVNDIKKVDVDATGSFVRFHDEFKPKGTNVNFVEVINEHEIFVRTYERGVEGETLSCGSGSTASAIFSALKKGCKSSVKVKTASGEVLNIHFKVNGEEVKEVYLEGKVCLVFEGNIAT